MTDALTNSGTAPPATDRADLPSSNSTGPHQPIRRWHNSLLVKTTSIFLVGVVFAYSLGALVGWHMFTSAAAEQWRSQARMNTQIASATLRNIYTYVAVEVDDTGQVNRIVTERPIGDDDSVLFTGFTPGDVLALITAQTKNDVWIFGYDEAAGDFGPVASTVTEASLPDQSQSKKPLLEYPETPQGQFATGFTAIEGERYYTGMLPIVRADGTMIGAVVASIGRETDLNRTQDELVRNSLVVLVLVLGLTTIVGTFVANRLFKPVPALIRATLRIANEQTDVATPFRHRTDEIGDLASAIETLREAVVERSHLRDIRDMAVELAHMAHHDPLTGLPNRALLMKSLEESVRGLRANKPFNVLMLDLDRFKSVNDTLGHASGDGLLKTTAERLVAVLGPGDLVARLGGDEFAVIQRVSRDPALEARKLASRILETISSSIMLDGQDLEVGSSIGIACAPADGAEASLLLKKADLALYRSKASGRGMFSFYQDGMDMAVQDQHALELDMRRALQRQEFELHYQPIVNLTSLDTCGFEALVRWRHPRRGMIPPDQFIPLAEETGMIEPLGKWILRQACRDAVSWPERFRLAVNLSPVQIRKAGLIDAVDGALRDSGLIASRLELEVTETVVLTGADSNVTLTALRAKGIGIVLDDFGTGYASLSNLVTLPFSKIKIDRSFVANLPDRKDCRAIVAAITSLARGLDIEVTAEGVETHEQLTFLKAAGCTNVQGYYFARPLPLAEIDLAGAAAFPHKNVGGSR